MAFLCRRLSHAYRVSGGPVPALDGISFAAAEHEFVCLVGPSGCGKTTLLKIVAGLIVPEAGEVVFSGNGGGDRPRTAMVFQDHGLFPWMSVLDNVAFCLEMRGVGRRERRKQARAFVERFGLGAFADRHPAELSMGMRQRVGIARAFLANPRILLMDEPFGALDAQTKAILQEELLRLWHEQFQTVLYVTHDIEEALLLGDRILVLSGRPARVLEDVAVPLGRPRILADRDRPEVIDLKWKIWRTLETEVRKTLDSGV
ncbi:MAG: ABC transporter ATP-binding protein [Candidatus Methylomirabilia bacterium]